MYWGFYTDKGSMKLHFLNKNLKKNTPKNGHGQGVIFMIPINGIVLQNEVECFPAVPGRVDPVVFKRGTENNQ